MQVDEYMRFDGQHYILTLKDIQEYLGINIEEKLSADEYVNQTKLIERLLEKVSHQTYGYLYQFNDSQVIDYIIAHSGTARSVIKHAMEEQFLYIWENGDMIDTDKPYSREMEMAFDVTIPETRRTLNYMGV